VPILLKSGSLKILEPLGSVQACTSMVLPLPLAGSSRKTDDLFASGGFVILYRKEVFYSIGLISVLQCL